MNVSTNEAFRYELALRDFCKKTSLFTIRGGGGQNMNILSYKIGIKCMKQTKKMLKSREIEL